MMTVFIGLLVLGVTAYGMYCTKEPMKDEPSGVYDDFLHDDDEF